MIQTDDLSKSPRRATPMSNTDNSNDNGHNREKDIAIACFDGGGPGVISELIILEEIAERFAYDSKTDDYKSHPTKYWDLIGGVGFGGMSALLLGRLHMTLEETMDELVTLGQAIYPRGLHETTPEENTSRLRNAVEDILRRNQHPIDIKLRESTQTGCKVIVFASPTTAMDHCQAFRTYKHRGRGLECTFVEAACAILAAPESFAPAIIGPPSRCQRFGGIPRGSINPTKEIFKEAQRIFGDEKPVSLVLSLGSGQKVPFSSSETRITRIMHDYGIVERELSRQLDSVPTYLRLNVDRGLETIENAHWYDIDPIVTSTQVYLEMVTTTNFIDEAVQRVLRGGGSITLGKLVGLNGATKLRFDTRELDDFLKKEIRSIRDTLQGVAEKITLIDAIGTRIPISLQLCGSYQMLTGIIRLYFEHCRPPGAGLVRQGHYQLVSGTQMEEVQRSQWTSLVAPGLTVEMSMVKHNRGNRDIACPKCGLLARERNNNTWATSCPVTRTFKLLTGLNLMIL
ncbi:hypothetical protein M408DRAFT_109282 [Serendipita vermifera MAFF 305830]|uniref:Ubiquitin-like domain-containing protein n=1 Tax=Serendipita vermifera MAFF 305830 TaxID=933852 RepID=A0A0C3AMQ7_SERVB|nr:hypothetical protein M408DRAFT_109282 [Serendipita vermifera MAFF 305830]